MGRHEKNIRRPNTLRPGVLEPNRARRDCGAYVQTSRPDRQSYLSCLFYVGTDPDSQDAYWPDRMKDRPVAGALFLDVPPFRYRLRHRIVREKSRLLGRTKQTTGSLVSRRSSDPLRTVVLRADLTGAVNARIKKPFSHDCIPEFHEGRSLQIPIVIPA